MVEGENKWVFDDIVIGGVGAASVIDHEMEKQLDVAYLFNTPVHEIAPAASQWQPRVSLMDEQGIWAQIVYPNVVGFGGQQIGGTGDVKLRNMTATIYNDALAEMQANSGNRLFLQAVLPWWDMDFCLTEIDRINSLGLVSVNTSADPQEIGLPDLGEPHWDEMWEKIAGPGLPVNFHIGASASKAPYFHSGPWPTMDDGAKMAIGTATLFLSNGRLIANMIYAGVLERHPDLKIIWSRAASVGCPRF